MTPARKDILLRVIVFMAASICWILHQHFVFLGFYGNDDYNYVKLAHDHLHGSNLLRGTDPYSLRELPVRSAAFWFRWLGYNETAFRMYPLLNLLLAGGGVALFMRKRPFYVYTLSVVLYFGAYSLLFYSHRLLPDPGIVFLFFMAFDLYHMARFPSGRGRREGWKGVGFAITLYLAMLTKETLLLFLPLFLWWLVSDLRNRRLRGFWFTAFAAGMVLILVYLFRNFSATGDPWHRWHVLQQSGYENICRFDLLPLRYTLSRVTADLFYAWMLNGDMLLVGLLVATFLYRKKLGLSPETTLMVQAGFILFLSANFMTISFTRYVPLCQDPRHFIFLLPFGAMAGALLLDAYGQRPMSFRMVPVFFGVITAILFLLKAGEMKYIYALFLCWLLAVMLVKNHLSINVSQWAGMSGLILILLIRPAYDITGRKDEPYRELRAMVMSDRFRELPAGTLYAPDLMTTELANWFRGFQPGGMHWVALDTLSHGKPKNRAAYLLSVEAANPELYKKAREIREDTVSGKALVILTSSPHIELYEVRDERIIDSLQVRPH